MTSAFIGKDGTCIMRGRGNKLTVDTPNKLSDEQVGELFWIVCAMSTTGKNLNELIKGDEE